MFLLLFPLAILPEFVSMDGNDLFFIIIRETMPKTKIEIKSLVDQAVLENWSKHANYCFDQ